MAALRDGSAMPNNLDDLTDSTTQAGSASSGWNVQSALTYVPSATFALRNSVLLRESQSSSQKPEVRINPVVR